MDTLYFDGKCPLCLREIRMLDSLRDEHLRLVDVHSYEPAPGEPSRESMLMSLHLRAHDGSWLSGVDATVKAWSHTRWGALFKPLRWPMLSSLADRVYEHWARRRFNGRYCTADCAGSGRSTQPRMAPQRDAQ
jgi:predicted DCC family thiol-disulfide oxidoreductase YuxK